MYAKSEDGHVLARGSVCQNADGLGLPSPLASTSSDSHFLDLTLLGGMLSDIFEVLGFEHGVRL